MNVNQLKTKIENLPAIQIGITNLQSFELSQRVATMFANSSLVPKDYQHNIANCLIAMNMANRLNADPLMIMQNLYIVHGHPSWSAQFLISAFNSCGRYTSITYDFTGEPRTDKWTCTAKSKVKATGEDIAGDPISLSMAKAEGWIGRKGSKWQVFPGQMLRYRAATFLVRAYAPELTMGLHTIEESQDIYEAEKDVTGAFSVADLKAEWPKAIEGGPGLDATWQDSTGQIFDPKQHAYNNLEHHPAVDENGVFVTHANPETDNRE